MQISNPLYTVGTMLTLLKGRLPGQVVLQYTDRCNAHCAQCGMRAGNPMQRATMDPDDVRRLIDAMAQRGVQALSFTGGEPLLCIDQIAPLLHYAGQAGIRFLRTGTNGYVFRGHDRPDFTQRMEHLASLLAGTPLKTFWISIDSAVSALHEQNRGLPGVVEGIRKALPIFHAHGLYPSANLGINRHTGGDGAKALPLLPPDAGSAHRDAFRTAACEAFSRFYTFAAELGFTIVNACYPMSTEPELTEQKAVYAATADDTFISFSHAEKIELFRALYETIPRFRSTLRIFTPRSALLALMRQYLKRQGYTRCRGGIDFFFIDAKEMDTYPCGYRGGENMGKFWDLDLDGLESTPHCDKCDWECFRDPSELLAPFAGGLRHPLSTLRRLATDGEMRRVWLQDLRYYRACDYFDGRTPPDYAKLKRAARCG